MLPAITGGDARAAWVRATPGENRGLLQDARRENRLYRSGKLCGLVKLYRLSRGLPSLPPGDDEWMAPAGCFACLPPDVPPLAFRYSMSITETLDPKQVAAARSRIRVLMAEMAQLAKAGLAPQEFHGELLSRVVSAVHAVGGAVWMRQADGSMALEYQIALADADLTDDSRRIMHDQLLAQVLSGGEGAAIAPQSGTEKTGNPTRFLLLVAPVCDHERTQGVIEIFQRPGADPQTERGYLNYLLQACSLAGEYLKDRQLREFRDRQAVWNRLQEFTRTVHGSLDLNRTSRQIADEGRRLLECDRVTVLVRQGGKYRVAAISGQDRFDSRSDLVRLMNHLAEAVASSGEPLWYEGQSADLPPQLESAAQRYLDESQSRLLAVYPLVEPGSSHDQRSRQGKVLGVLMAEQIDDARPKERMAARMEGVREHAALALANSLAFDGGALVSAFRRLAGLFSLPSLPKAAIVGGVLAAAVAALCLVPADFELEGRGILQPVQRREVFAGVSGVVTQVNVRHGDQVLASSQTPLLQLENPALDERLASLDGQIAATVERSRAVQNTLLSERDLRPAEKDRLRGEMAQLEQTKISLNEQLRLAQQQREQLQIFSPIDGMVTTWDVHDRLVSRPVERGQVLLSVADPSREWELDIRMPEDRMGHILEAQKASGGELQVRFILATDPGVSYLGHVKEIHRRAEVHSEAGNSVSVKVTIDKQQLPQLRPGATVVAKVACGERSLGYVWLHDLWAFVQTRILF